jgi:hypothetical protein
MSTKIIKLGCLAAFFFILHQAAAQNLILSGRVFDDKSNEPLVGVNIQLKGHYIGSVTDNEGRFQLNL